jgi:DNA-binding transcriptional ArsR family regulator
MSNASHGFIFRRGNPLTAGSRHQDCAFKNTVHIVFMRQYRHPSLRSVSLAKAMQALSDPWRIGIVQDLLDADGKEFTCSEFPMSVSKATRSHHLEVLRQAGLIRTRVNGKTCLTCLRAEEFEKRFPGLLALIKSR